MAASIGKYALVYVGDSDPEHRLLLEQSLKNLRGHHIFVASSVKPQGKVDFYTGSSFEEIEALLALLKEEMTPQDELLVYSTGKPPLAPPQAKPPSLEARDQQWGGFLADIQAARKIIVTDHTHEGRWNKFFSGDAKVFFANATCGEDARCSLRFSQKFWNDEIYDLNQDGQISWKERYAKTLPLERQLCFWLEQSSASTRLEERREAITAYGALSQKMNPSLAHAQAKKIRQQLRASDVETILNAIESYAGLTAFLTDSEIKEGALRFEKLLDHPHALVRAYALKHLAFFSEKLSSEDLLRISKKLSNSFLDSDSFIQINALSTYWSYEMNLPKDLVSEGLISLRQVFQLGSVSPLGRRYALRAYAFGIEKLAGQIPARELEQAPRLLKELFAQEDLETSHGALWAYDGMVAVLPIEEVRRGLEAVKPFLNHSDEDIRFRAGELYTHLKERLPLPEREAFEIKNHALDELNQNNVLRDLLQKSDE